MPYITNEGIGYILHGRGHGPEGTLYQIDWDYPALAQDLGWSLRRVQKRGSKVVSLSRWCGKGCEHSFTDGTITCPDCGVTASEFIGAAGNYLQQIAK